jgi:hypothetical protein
MNSIKKINFKYTVYFTVFIFAVLLMVYFSQEIQIQFIYQLTIDYSNQIAEFYKNNVFTRMNDLMTDNGVLKNLNPTTVPQEKLSLIEDNPQLPEESSKIKDIKQSKYSALAFVVFVCAYLWWKKSF